MQRAFGGNEPPTFRSEARQVLPHPTFRLSPFRAAPLQVRQTMTRAGDSPGRNQRGALAMRTVAEVVGTVTLGDGEAVAELVILIIPLPYGHKI